MACLGKRDVLKDFGVDTYPPSEMSVVYQSFHEAKWFTHFIKIDQDLNVSIEQRGLAKLRGFHDLDILLGAGFLEGLREFAFSIRTETEKETCDPRAVLGSYSNFLEGIEGRFKRGDPRSIPEYLGLTTSILAELVRFRGYTVPRGRMMQFQMTNALISFLKSMETVPPSVDLLLRASRLLDASFATDRPPLGPSNARDYPAVHWNQVRSKLRGGDWDTLMNFPFGTVVLHRPFPIILA